MRTGGLVLGVLLFVAGAVWTAQGLNLPMAPHSFMTSDRSWIVIGLITAAAGATLALWSRRRART